jgi:hypothetical protein
VKYGRFLTDLKFAQKRQYLSDFISSKNRHPLLKVKKLGIGKNRPIISLLKNWATELLHFTLLSLIYD